MLTRISGGGSFTRQNIADINDNFAALSQVDIWVRPQAAIGGATGSFDRPFGSMAACSRLIESGIVIGLEGVLKEHYTGPIVNNVTIVGQGAVPRQATTSGVPNGGGATWLSPDTPTNSSALIRVQGQAWTLKNIYFNNQANANGCVQPFTTGDPPLLADGAHILVDNCILTGVFAGIYASGGTNYVNVQDSTIFGFTAGTGIAQTVGAGIGTILNWRVLRCRFFGNAHNIVAPANKWEVRGCTIQAGTSSTVNLTGGTAPNYVQQNTFNITAADFDPAGGVTGVSGDAWSNYLIDAVETGLPTN